MKNEISLCMIVKNEEDNLQRCLNSVKDIVDEVIIVDTGSTDKTVYIAESFGASVYNYIWDNNFSEARNESLKYASKDWILIMDADDEFCRDDKEAFLQLISSSLEEKTLYYFETLNYCGSFADSSNISINLNPRLFKNNLGYKYEGEVHNQLVNHKISTKDVCVSIKIYHYGYLDSNIKGKDKRKRNIFLLEEQLKKEPDNKYALFNLGNEYFASNEIAKALDYYYKSYENFTPAAGYGFILVLRIVLANYFIGLYTKALEFTDIGIQYYPGFTDLYYFKGCIYKSMDRPLMAVRAWEKCIEIGDPPSGLKFLYGTGSFKAMYELALICMEQKDYHSAYKYFNETIRIKPDLIISVYKIAYILKEENVASDEFKYILELFFEDDAKAAIVLADICYSVGYYEAALEYIKKCEENGIKSDDVRLLEIKALVRTGDFEKGIQINNFDSNHYFFPSFSMYKVICAIMLKEKLLAFYIIDSLKNNSFQDKNKKIYESYTQLVNLFFGKETQVLTEDEKEKEYTAIIFEILEIFLINKRFDEFYIAINLLNLISDKSVLLHLGKLYYKYGYFDMSKKELIRSIKEFEIYDKDALNILKQL
ncbi:tetratricopeptide repeat protein [Ruminiclostridium sufflavum DSM 19573]|uniref:Tetratricopeptide repeat protein n=1 Tax=Ruminiclostridium sufflavum DSM 19573 TaxID=1121337 RepID=A0A318XXJ4_9FIRM|nr:glycosyltransferase family 2 protein [Ruminiclostridium sufflavum]PYG87517.1 tetratricopeptide repeat protein [Ruminiclostridium sufflavum DSM 19573]